MNYTESHIRTNGIYFDIYYENNYSLLYLPKKLLYISNNNILKYQVDTNIVEEILEIPFQTIFYTWGQPLSL